MSSSAVRTEAGMTVTYGQTSDVTLGEDSVYIDLALTRDTERSVEAYWDSNRTATLAPGQSVSYVVLLENTGNIADTYTFTYTNTGFDVSFSPEEVPIDFGTNGNTAYMVAEVTVGSTAEAGNNTITVTVRSGSQASTRATVDLVVRVSPERSVSVEPLNESVPASTNVTTVKFLLNNTGNIGDDYVVAVSNTDALNVSGWSVRIVDPATGGEVKNVTLGAFESRELAVEFTAKRTTADPKAVAVVHAYSSLGTGTDSLGAVSVMLPDLVIGPGGLDVTRSDVTYDYDIGRIYLDVGLAASLAALVVVFFVLRRRKGLGGGGSK
ncbi:MAG: hypothetical protein MUE55_08435 [Thermoplasmata archaeon]|nr:hypothetical protein [Thermoplasmata archaeon]